MRQNKPDTVQWISLSPGWRHLIESCSHSAQQVLSLCTFFFLQYLFMSCPGNVYMFMNTKIVYLLIWKRLVIIPLSGRVTIGVSCTQCWRYSFVYSYGNPFKVDAQERFSLYVSSFIFCVFTPSKHFSLANGWANALFALVRFVDVLRFFFSQRPHTHTHSLDFSLSSWMLLCNLFS